MPFGTLGAERVKVLVNDIFTDGVVVFSETFLLSSLVGELKHSSYKLSCVPPYFLIFFLFSQLDTITSFANSLALLARNFGHQAEWCWPPNHPM